MSFGWQELSAAGPALWEGMKVTLEVTLIAIVGGAAIGTLLAMARLSAFKPLAWVASLYVNFFRSVPKLLTLMWFLYAVPLAYLLITKNFVPFDTKFMAAVAAFVIFESAYFSEVVRAGIQAVSKGQVNAAYALGMTYSQVMRLVVLPQAFRKMTPLLLQESIILFQDTTLVVSIGLMDFFGAANQRGGSIGLMTEYILFAGLVYFLISTLCSMGVTRLKSKLRV